MKNLKKVLAMVLAFACTFSMFAGAKVFEDVPAGSDYSEAVTMLSDLGVIQGKDDGKYHPEDTITRAEACAMIARLMTGDPNVSQYVGAQSFTDVAKGSWKDSAIGYCYINGIVIGVGNNKFEPDRAITDAEFITMVVRAMGYETADMKQNYPYSYMSNAQAIGLLDGTNMVASTDALRGEDAQVIYNALFTDYARGAKLVNTTHGTSVETYPTLAESVWGLERAAVGTWSGKDDETATLTNCKAHTWVVVGADKDNEGYILAYPIDDDTTDVYETQKDDADGVSKKGYYAYSFKYDGDASAVAGYQVELWGEGQHGEPTWEKSGDKVVYSEDWTIKAIKTVKGQTAYDYNASMADSKSTNGTIELGETSLDLDSVATNASNVEMANTTETGIFTYLSDDKYNNVTLDKSDKKVEEALNVRDGAQYKLMDWDSDGDVDWVVIDEANYYKVEAVNSTRLTVSSMDTVDKVEDEQDSKNVTWKLNDLTDVSGVKYDFKTEEDLAEGDIIEVTYSVAYNKSEKEEVVTATITKVEADTAELDKVSTKDDLELTFDGEVKKIADNKELGDVVVPANPKTYGDFDDEELGTQFNLWTNRNGFIVYSDYANETVNYLMVLDTADGSDKTGDRKLAKADVLFADNSVKKDVEFASGLTIDGKDNGDNGYDSEDRTWNEKLVVGNVYKYWQNEDGVITKMEAMFTDEALSDSDYSYDQSADRLKDASDKKIATLEEAKVLFAVTENFITETYDADKVGDYDVEADADKIMAVKQADIPEIVKSTTGDTKDTKADRMVNTTNNWLGAADADAKFIAEVDDNGETSAAILGVENFNKFNAANTTVGLVTSVSYDKNDVVEIEVAYKGEVTTVKSAEKVDFDDVVKQFNGTSDAGLTTKQAADKLKNNALYAEITTNADGVLTAVTFMNVDGNTATGHYYEVSRRIISDVTNVDVAYGAGEYTYYNNKNLYSVVDRLDVQDKDLADAVDYYTIDGRPTTSDDKYEDVVLAVANGFDGTPDITAETDSNLVESYINNKFDDADTYQVADLAYKIGGDIVAAYAFEDSLGEVAATNGAQVTPVPNAALEAGESNQKIAGVTLYDASATVSKVTIKKDGAVVTNVQGQVTGTELLVSADVDAAVGTGYTAEFTVGTGKEARTYKVEFEVKAKSADTLDDTKAGTVVTPGAKAKTEAKAAVEYAVTKGTTDGEFFVAVNGDVAGAVAVTSTTGDNETASAIQTALDGSKYASDYTFTVSSNTVKAEAKVAKTGETITLSIVKGNEYASFGDASGKVTGQETAAEVPGVAELTLAGDATKAANYELKIGETKTFTIEVAADDKVADVANKIAIALLGDADLTVEINGSKLTFTEKSTKEGTVIVEDTEVSFAAK